MATTLGSCLVFMFNLYFQTPFLYISSGEFNKPSFIHNSLEEELNVPETVLGSWEYNDKQSKWIISALMQITF